MKIINKWKERYKHYKQNPIEYFEDCFGVKLTKFQKIKLKTYNAFINHLQELVDEQKELIGEILIEPYGTTRYKVLELHSIILDLKIILIKELFRIK